MGLLTAAYPLLENTIPEFRAGVQAGSVGTFANMHFGGNVTIDGTLTTTGTGMEGAQVITAASANALAVGPNGTTNPTFNIDSSASNAATGINIAGAAAGSKVTLSVLSSGTNESLAVDAKGSGTIFLGDATSGRVQVGSGATVGSAFLNVQSSVAASLTVGPNGATTPVFQVDSSTASAVAGLKLTGAVTGGTVAIVATDSGSNTNLTFNSKGSGTINIGNVSTGAIAIGRGSAKPLIESATIAALGTSQNSTPTAAQLTGGVVTQTGATGAGTVTLDNGTNISAAIPGVTVGDTFQCIFANLGGGQTLTITSATGATVVGNGAVPTGKNAIITFVNTGSNAWNAYVSVSA